MTSLIAWAPLATVVALFGALVGAALAAAGVIVARRPLRHLAPVVRGRVLASLMAIPAVAAVAAVVVAFAPSALDAMGLVRDHCHHHRGHAFHLCFTHGVPPAGTWPLAVLFGLSLLFAYAARREFVTWRRARAWATRLRAVGVFNPAERVWEIPHAGVAFTIGLLRPEVFVSTGAELPLDARQRAAVLAHEHEHVRRRDALHKLTMRLLALLHFPIMARYLLAELDLAAEQACDAAAARQLGDATDVASAIVAMARAGSVRTPRSAVAFGAIRIEARVEALLRTKWSQRAPVSAPGLAAAAAVALAHSYESLHHTLESALQYLF